MENGSKIGIDISLNSTGIVQFTNNKIQFYSLFRVDKPEKFLKLPHIEMLKNAGVLFYSTEKLGKVTHDEIIEKGKKKGQIEKVLNYSATEVNKILCDISISNHLDTIIKESDIIAMEGMSYASPGNSKVDIAILTGILRSTIIRKVSDSKFSVYSPSSVKLFATGKGNANKMQMLESFIWENIELAKIVKDNWSTFMNKKGEILSPLTDLVDAYFVGKMLL